MGLLITHFQLLSGRDKLMLHKYLCNGITLIQLHCCYTCIPQCPQLTWKVVVEQYLYTSAVDISYLTTFPVLNVFQCLHTQRLCETSGSTMANLGIRISQGAMLHNSESYFFQKSTLPPTMRITQISMAMNMNPLTY